MPAVVALPKNVSLAADEVAVTVVVPAPKGCNLNCPFCFIRARKEADPASIVLGADDYVRFIDGMVKAQKVVLVSIQGYEPLLPESWPTTRAILEKAGSLGVRTALVTNGTHLSERVDELVALGLGGITVSLDSDRAVYHDQTRRTTGAFDQTIAGIRRAAESSLRDVLIVASVLQRGKSHYLEGMPQLLASLGLHFWVVTAVYKAGSRSGQATVEPPGDVVKALTGLYRVALSSGVSMLVDDEFDALIHNAGEAIDLAKLRLRRLSRLNQVVRLSPDGTCSIGEEILGRSGASNLVWDPSCEEVSAFVERVAAVV
jgi:sulfatase maturation enzyme AslB (radical SAM superfamily)